MHSRPTGRTVRWQRMILSCLEGQSEILASSAHELSKQSVRADFCCPCPARSYSKRSSLTSWRHLCGFQPQDIRNVVFLGHAARAKRHSARHALRGRSPTRLEALTDGTSLLDHTTSRRIASTRWTVDGPPGARRQADHLIDAPGYPDFIGGAISTGGADIAAVVISARPESRSTPAAC